MWHCMGKDKESLDHNRKAIDCHVPKLRPHLLILCFLSLSLCANISCHQLCVFSCASPSLCTFLQVSMASELCDLRVQALALPTCPMLVVAVVASTAYSSFLSSHSHRWREMVTHLEYSSPLLPSAVKWDCWVFYILGLYMVIF